MNQTSRSAPLPPGIWNDGRGVASNLEVEIVTGQIDVERKPLNVQNSSNVK